MLLEVKGGLAEEWKSKGFNHSVSVGTSMNAPTAPAAGHET
jgi:hypothetical protein